MTDGPATTVLSQAEIDRFHVDGFLLVEDFFSHEELRRFGESVDAAVKRRTSGDNRSLMEKNLYEQSFMQCMGLWEDEPSVRPFTFHPKLCAASAALLQSDCIRLWHDQALYKEAGGRETDAHLDYPFWPIDTPDLVSVWIPFDDVGPGGGMMSYVQGSHTKGITEFVDIGQLRGGDRHDLLRNPQVASLPLIAVAAPKGSAIFHHACTIHAADANETGGFLQWLTWRTAVVDPGTMHTLHSIATRSRPANSSPARGSRLPGRAPKMICPHPRKFSGPRPGLASQLLTTPGSSDNSPIS